MDRSLDEILAGKQHQQDRRQTGGSRSRHGGYNNSSNSGRRSDRRDFPRDGVRKVPSILIPPAGPVPEHGVAPIHSPEQHQRFADDGLPTDHPSYIDETRRIDSEWVHDKFEDDNRDSWGSRPRQREELGSRARAPRGTKLRVENLHWKLTHEDLEELFERIGPTVKVEIEFDRSGRSLGVAYVIYQSRDDAHEAIREYDGANANGQPIRLIELGSDDRRNPVDFGQRPGRSLEERVTGPRDRDRSPAKSPPRYTEEEAARKGIDRYVPGPDSHSRSPAPRRRQLGRRPGARREESARNNGGEGSRAGSRVGRNGRPRKTQEELDAEMEDYFTTGSKAGEPAGPNAAAAAVVARDDDIDMIE